MKDLKLEVVSLEDGKLTLLKSTMFSLLIYFMSSLMIPKKVEL